jgi:hypothetical protein
MNRACPSQCFTVLASLSALSLLIGTAGAQLTDLTQTPNTANAGIHKSLAEEIGGDRGDVMTPDSSMFIIQRDPFRAIRRGRQLFQRKFTVGQGFGPRTGDGAGDIEADPSIGAGLVDSCAGCHSRPRGSAGAGGNVFTRPDSRDAPHLFGLGLKEMLGDEITTDLRAIRTAAIAEAKQQAKAVTKALMSKGIDYGQITAFPDGSLDTSMVEGVDPDLRVRPFFAHGGEFSIRAFTVGALHGEMGLQAPDPDLGVASQGGRTTTPSGMVLDGSIDRIDLPPTASTNEIPTSLVDYLEFYLLNYFKPGSYQQTIMTRSGGRIFEHIGCAQCHIPDLPIERDRRVADVETVYLPTEGVFNNLFATATTLNGTLDDGSGFPAGKPPLLGSFLVKNIFGDFKRHDLGPNFHERNFDGTVTTHFMTALLWGVGSTGPYGHDGRSMNLREVILRHGGEAQAPRDAFAQLPMPRQEMVLRFLESLILFPPDDTASNLDPADPNTPGFPQQGHGSIKLTVLFNNPSDPE